ncbi:MAG: putative lipid II flippase FtsW [Planctomycetes bacterium]|nr:putative lipid II flippase FtsW [Planctomycetota bacterium]
MIRKSNIKYHHSDTFLLLIVAVILIFGLVSLISASGAFAYAGKGDAYYYVEKQLFGLAVGLIAFLYFASTDYRIWKKYALGFLVFSIILLLLVFIPGLSAAWGKSRSWINFFGYSLQPSELVKLSFLLYLAAWLENRKDNLRRFSQGSGPFIIILSIISLLMLLQPDVGTLSIIGLTSLIVYFVGGGSLKHIILILLFTVIAFTAMIQIRPYQLNRFKCLIDPSNGRQDVCYQVNQSLIAVGSGGLTGRGLGASRQKYMYLPEVYADSIFAVIAEETGLVFSATLVALYSLLFYRGYLIAKNSLDDFGRILAIGISSWIAIQAFVNIGGIINIIPMTGVPLPLISYGGSALLASLSALGILTNISRQTKLRHL